MRQANADDHESRGLAFKYQQEAAKIDGGTLPDIGDLPALLK